MKKIILLIVMLMSSLFLMAQQNENDYPQYLIKGNDTLVVFTLKQTQKIDNDYDLIALLKKYKVGADSLQSYYISVVDDQNNQIAALKVTVNKYQEIETTQKSMISDLRSQIDNYKQLAANKDTELKNKDQIIKNKDKDIKKLKRQKIIGFATGVIGIIIAIAVAL